MSLSRFFFKVEEKYLGKLVEEGNIFWIYLRGQANVNKIFRNRTRKIDLRSQRIVTFSFFFFFSGLNESLEDGGGEKKKKRFFVNIRRYFPQLA